MAWFSNPSCLRLALVSASLLMSGAPARAEEVNPFLPPGLPAVAAPSEAPNPLDRYEFRGVMTIGGDTFVTLVDTASSRSVTIPLGGTVENIKASDFRADDGSVQIASGGQTKRAKLRESKIVAMAAPPPPPPPPMPGVVNGQMPGGPPGVASAPISDEEARNRMQRVAEEIRRRREMRRQMLENQGQTPAAPANR